MLFPIQRHGINLTLCAHFFVLVSQSGLSDEIAPALPEAFLNLHLVAAEGDPTGIHVRII